VSSDLLAYRDRFPILGETTYLVNHSLGAMPSAVDDRLQEYAETWRRRGVRAWAEGWWDLPLTVGDQVGRIVGAPRGTTVMHQNVSVAAGIVLSCFPFSGARRRIVYVEGEFPSVRYLLQAQAERGAEVVVVENEEALLAAIDDRTLLVPVSHVLFRTGELVDIGAVVARARAAGAYVLLDAYQSAGIVPLDVTALGVDFAVGGSVKWLCGGPGAGWLYVRPELAAELRPTLLGWQAHARPFSFEPELQYAEGAARFLTGTPNVPALYAATAGYDVVEEIGVERIRERSLALTRRLISLAEAAGFTVASPRADERRGGTVVVRTPADEAVHRELDSRSIICDFRPGTGIRFGPHFFTSEEEVDFAAGQLAEIVQSGAYRRHEGAEAVF
jgi:kynureninase